MKGGLALSDAVVIEKCDNYDIENVRERIKEGLQLLGGIEKWVKPGMTVVLKPNLLTRKSPEQAVTTHPHIVQAVAELIQKAGAKAVIVDSPGGPDSKAYLRSVYKTTGMEEVAGKTGAIVSYNPQKVELKFEGGSQFRKFTLLKTIVEADLVINLPKLKTHGLTLISCAVKNLYDLTGSAWEGKLVGLMAVGGGRASYMAPMNFLNGLMLNARCLVIPRYVYALEKEIDQETLKSEEVKQRIEQLVKTTIEMAERLII
ncbi:MAG: hypothetical protein PWQ96_2113 [Clostridia bacterium]|nr:hypothetical protein [Clostridia bacterium]